MYEQKQMDDHHPHQHEPIDNHQCEGEGGSDDEWMHGDHHRAIEEHQYQMGVEGELAQGLCEVGFVEMLLHMRSGLPEFIKWLHI